MATSGLSLFGPNAGGIADWVGSGAVSYVANADWVRDPYTGRLFKCILSHTPVVTDKPPSKDATRWKGEDASDVGTTRIQAHLNDDGGWLVMSPGRVLQRAEHPRLLDKLAPQVSGIGITAGSSLMRLPGSLTSSIVEGEAIEVAGVPAGAVVGSVSTAGATKVGTVDSGTGPGTTSRIFFRSGVLALGYQITPPVEVSGTGLGASTTITSTVADMTAVLTTTLASMVLYGAPAVTAFNAAVPGQYASGAGIPANARVTAIDPITVGTANSRSVTGSPSAFMSADFYSQIDETKLIGRQLTMTGFAGTATVVAIANPEESVGGTWNWVTGLGYFAPWDLGAGDVAKVIANRKLSGGPITDAGSQHVTAVNASAQRNGATNAGVSSYFWQSGQLAITQTVERLVGNAAAVFPAGSYVTAHANDIAVNLDARLAETALGFAIGAAAQGVVGQYVSHVGAGISQARITAVQAEWTSPNASTVSGSNQLFVQPGTPLSQMRAGERVSSSTGSIPAATTLTALGADETVATAALTSGSSQVNLPVGTSTAPFTTGRKITATGIPANANVASVSAPVATSASQILRSGSATINLTPGSGAAAVWANRYIIDTANALPAGARISSVVTDFTIATLRASAGVQKLFWPVGGSIANVNSDAAFTLPLAWPVTPARLTSAPVAQFTAVNSTTVNASNQLRLLPGAALGNMAIGQQVTATGVAAGTSIVAIGADAALPGAFTLNAVARLFMQVGASSAPVAVNSKVSGTGIPTPSQFTAVGAEAATTTLGTFAGSATLFFTIGASTAASTAGRFVDVAGGITNGQINGAVTAQTTQLTCTTAIGAPEVFLPGGAALSANMQAGAYIASAALPGNVRVFSTTAADAASVPATANRILGQSFVHLPVGTGLPGALLVGRGISGTGIAASNRITSLVAEAVVGNVTANGTTTLTGAGIFTAAMVGKYISGGTLPANLRITAFTNTNTVTVSAVAPAGVTLNAVIGASVGVAVANTASTFAAAVTLAGYMTADSFATASGQNTLTIGAFVPLTSAATGTSANGAASTWGAVHTISNAATASGNAGAIVGAIITMSANALASSNVSTATFAPWADVDTLPAAAQSAGATGTFGAVLTLASPANATALGDTLTIGPAVNISANATATTVATDGILGAVHTMSANATAATTTATITFGRWIDTTASAAATVSGGAATLGAVSSISSPAAANDNTPLTFGLYAPVATVVAGTQRGVSNVRAGAILTLGANATSTNAAVAPTFGVAITIDAAATAAGSPSVTLAGFANHDSANTTQTIDTTLSFGATVTMARAIIPGCTYTNQAGDVRSAATPTTIRCPDTSMIVVGQGISGPNIPGGATVASITDGTTFVISASVTGPQANVTLLQTVNATATNDNASGRIFPFGAGDGATTFGIGLDTAGRALTIGGGGSGMESVPLGALTGAERHVMHTSQMPPHNHNVVASANSVPLGGWGYIPRSSGGGDTIATTDATAGEPNLTWTVIAPWDNGSGAPMPLSGPRVAVGKAVAIYAGAM